MSLWTQLQQRTGMSLKLHTVAAVKRTLRHIHKTTADTSHCQDGRIQYCVIMSGLRQHTAARHIHQQPRQAAGSTELNGQSSLSASHSYSATELHQQLYGLLVLQWITYNPAVIRF